MVSNIYLYTIVLISVYKDNLLYKCSSLQLGYLAFSSLAKVHISVCIVYIVYNAFHV